MTLADVKAWADQKHVVCEVIASRRDQVGDPTTEAGSRDASYLSAGRLHTAVVSCRFKDYFADVSATNIPGRGLTLREHYMSARD
ncbi:MAG: hypothetical protein ABW061_07090 [Polyangiaceae bacterium]